MVCRQIDIDEDTDHILTDLAQDYQGDLGKALSDLIHAHESVEDFVGRCEEAHRDSLSSQVQRAERDFAEGRFATWDAVKRRNEL